ncbi:MAG: hypothetical protein PWR07_2223 [Bacillota bacterium]|nr:hypothetical protein [Bacillota bacterium]MDK2932092.1 hypothetical protein [Bacillota bacterium]
MGEVIAMSTEMSSLVRRICRLPVEEQMSILNSLRGRLEVPGTGMVGEMTSEERLAALEAAFGAWSGEDHPDLKAAEDIHKWIEEIRHGGERRNSKEA